MSSEGHRLPAVDLLKAVAAQLIVLHHLAFYGPMSDHAAVLAPPVFEALARHARMAVQVFLVVGGYLAARQLAPEGRWVGGSAWSTVGRRYLRLVLPFAVTLLVAVAAAAVGRALMDHPATPEAPTALQLLAHVLLVSDVLGFDALSAGVWYIAIDFQLFVLLVAALWGCAAVERRWGVAWPLAPALVMLLALASLFYFNRDAAWDVSAPYFLTAYSLGVLAAWWPLVRRPMLAAAALALLLGAGLYLEWRTRLMLAAAVAVVLALAEQRGAGRLRWIRSGALAWLARVSYGIFLLHYPVSLVVNALFTRYGPANAWVQACGLGVAWAASVGAGALFYRWVEAPAGRWLTRPKVSAAASGLGA